MRQASVVEIAPKQRLDRARIPSDAELVQRLADGDDWAKEALYRKYFANVWWMSQVPVKPTVPAC
jgi:hypothetical protein